LNTGTWPKGPLPVLRPTNRWNLLRRNGCAKPPSIPLESLAPAVIATHCRRRLENSRRPRRLCFRHPDCRMADRILSQCLRCPDPLYSDEARQAKMQGQVTMRVLVGLDGRARDIQVTRGIGLGLDENAVRAVRGWQF